MKKLFTLIAVAAMAFVAQANVLSVAQDTWYSGVYPVYGLWYDTPGESQMIYPADMLTEMAGGDITELSFLTLGTLGDSEYGDFSDYTIGFSGGELQLALKEVDQLGFEEEVFVTGATVVANTVPEYGALTLDFVLDEPFHYNGGNLLVEVTIITEGGYGTTYFLGTAFVDEYENDLYYASMYVNYGYSGDVYSSGLSSFIPAVDFTYTPGGAPVEPPVEPITVGAPVFQGYTIDGITGYGVGINPTTEGSEIMYRVLIWDPVTEEWVLRTDWTLYEGTEGEIWFENNGEKVRIEAYAFIGDNRSQDVAYEFTVATALDELMSGKTVANVRYFNVAGQEMQQAEGLTIVVTTYTDGTTNAVKVVK